MPLAVRTAAGVKDIAALVMRDASNTPRNIQELWARTQSGLVQVLGKLTAGLSSTVAQGSVNRVAGGPVTTRAVQALPNGGVAPYTYLWARTDGGGHPWTINSPTAAITTFTTNVGTNVDQLATFHCTITDATGQSAVTASVDADCWNDGGGL